MANDVSKFFIALVLLSISGWVTNGICNNALGDMPKEDKKSLSDVWLYPTFIFLGTIAVLVLLLGFFHLKIFEALIYLIFPAYLVIVLFRTIKRLNKLGVSRSSTMQYLAGWLLQWLVLAIMFFLLSSA